MGAHSAPNPDRYACTNHVPGNSCDNARAAHREALESHVLTGLRERMMTPEIAADAMRAYTQETNRLNRQRRSSSESTRPELAEAAKRGRDSASLYGLRPVRFTAISSKRTCRRAVWKAGNHRPHRTSSNSRFGRQETGSAIQRLMSDSCQPVPLVLILS